MQIPPNSRTAAAQLLGYLNFSSRGTFKADHLKCLNDLFVARDRLRRAAEVRVHLLAGLAELRQRDPAFADVRQAEAVIGLAFDRCLPAYHEHHRDLLFHLTNEDFEHPLFVGRVLEATLEQGGPWNETERIVSGCLDRLNCFLGHRPVAVLENGRKMEPYPHERFRPIPLYIQGVGAGHGPYHELISRTIRMLEDTPANILQESFFDPRNLEELALDVRAHDHMHPMNKRTNYMFGEWDPHLISLQGDYRRFVVRKIILDALLRWMESQEDVDPDEVLFDASAVLCGTMLMASSVSGAGPSTFDSSATLSGLLPRVARQRDSFYERLLKTATQERAKRLRNQANLTRQPFGHVRQRLNIELATYGARQVQYRHLAQLYAKMGYVEASRRQAALIPSTSVRFETEIRWRIASAHQRLERGDLAGAAPFAAELDDLLHRGIACGAIVDPWSILGFQGQFPLFHAREDSLPDQRVEVLLELVDGIFGVFSRLLNEASAQGDAALGEDLGNRYRRLADEWDRYATTTVEDLPKVNGRESYESALHVSKALSEWRRAGESAGAISFWRQQIADFDSSKSYSLVVEALLQRNDVVASMGLLMQWLSQAEETGLESGGHSLFPLLLRWMDLVIATGRATGDNATLTTLFRRLFDYLEANAGEYWTVPALDSKLGPAQPQADAALAGADEGELDEDEDDEDGGLYEAAWDNVVWRDSADDGQIGDTLDEAVPNAQDTEFEILARGLEPRLRFLATLAELWQKAAVVLAGQCEPAEFDRPDARGIRLRDVVASWRDRALEMQSGLGGLLNAIRQFEVAKASGDFDSNIEFDTQHQTKLFLLHNVINTTIGHRLAERYLACCLSAPQSATSDPKGAPAQSSEKGASAKAASTKAAAAKKKAARLEELQLEVFHAVFRRDAATVRRLLPDLTRRLSAKPLLYVSLENGGNPEQVLEVRTLQAGMRFLLSQLPSLGLLDETLSLLNTCFKMEKSHPPRGQAVTEFDRLFRIALRSSLEAVCRSAAVWRLPPAPLAVSRRGKGRCTCRQEMRRATRSRLSAGPSIIGEKCRRCIPCRRVKHKVKHGVGRNRRNLPLHPNGTSRALSFRVPSWLSAKMVFPSADLDLDDLELDALDLDPRDSAEAERGESAGRRGRDRIGWRNVTLVMSIAAIVHAFRDLWIRHSNTMRLSQVEALHDEEDWRDVQKFIKTFGHDLFSARMLMLGNVRAILHNGVDWYLEHLAENEDPLHPIPLLEALRRGRIDADDAEHWMELIYGTIVDRFDRFLEYNTTTTQSDYGEMLHCLLGFLRVEATYDRDAWQLAPDNICHELLTELGRAQVARVWERLYRDRTTEKADQHVDALRQAEQGYGMRLPSLADHIQERFVKPLAVNRMLALVPRAVDEAKLERSRSTAFETLRKEIDAYLESSSGSGIDIPMWLRNLEREVERVLEAESSRDVQDADVRLPPLRLTLNQTQRQIASCLRIAEEQHKSVDRRRT